MPRPMGFKRLAGKTLQEIFRFRPREELGPAVLGIKFGQHEPCKFVLLLFCELSGSCKSR